MYSDIIPTTDSSRNHSSFDEIAESPLEEQSTILDPFEIKYVTEAVTDETQYKVISPKLEFICRWKTKLNKYLAQLQFQLKDFNEFLEDEQIWEDQAKHKAVHFEFKTPNKQQLEVQQLVLLVQMCEKTE